MKRDAAVPRYSLGQCVDTWDCRANSRQIYDLGYHQFRGLQRTIVGQLVLLDGQIVMGMLRGCVRCGRLCQLRVELEKLDLDVRDNNTVVIDGRNVNADILSNRSSILKDAH